MFELASKWLDDAISYFCSSFSAILASANSIGDGIEDMLVLNPSSAGSVSANFAKMITAVVDNGIPIFQGMGIALALLFNFIGIIELASQDQLTPEKLIKQLAKFAAAFGAIMYAKEICYGVINLGNWFIQTTGKAMASAASATGNFTSVGEFAVNNNTGGTTKTLSYILGKDNISAAEQNVIITNAMKMAFHKALKGAGVSTAITLYVQSFNMFIPALLMNIATFVCFFMALSRGLELGIRTIFMPVPMGLMAEDGWRGAGGRYIKKYMAVASQGMVMIAAVKVMQVFVGAVMNTVMSDIFFAVSKYNIGDEITEWLVENGYSTNGLTALVTYETFAHYGADGNPFGGTEDHIISDICSTCAKNIWLAIVTVFAGLGMVSKSLQICSDVWGV